MTDPATKIPWPDEPDNPKRWGWWDETPHRIEVDGPDDPGNIDTAVFDVMWDRNPADRHDDTKNQIDDYPGGRWLLWDDPEIPVAELLAAIDILKGRRRAEEA